MRKAIMAVAFATIAVLVAGSAFAQAPTYLDPTQTYLGTPGQGASFGPPPGRGQTPQTTAPVAQAPRHWVVIPLYHVSPETIAAALGADNVIYGSMGGGYGGYGGGGYGGGYGGNGVTQGYGGQGGLGRRAQGRNPYSTQSNGGNQYGGGNYGGNQYGGRGGYGRYNGGGYGY